jgi:hypothetical protein
MPDFDEGLRMVEWARQSLPRSKERTAEVATSQAFDLPDYQARVQELEDCTLPLPAWRRELALALQAGLCGTEWTIPQERAQAQELLFRLAVLLERKGG